MRTMRNSLLTSLLALLAMAGMAAAQDPEWVEQTLFDGHPTDVDGIRYLDVGDLDGDGDRDIALIAYESDEFGWLEADGDGWTYHFIAEQSQAFTIAVLDADNDNDLDIAVGSISSTVGLRWYRNEGNGLFTFRPRIDSNFPGLHNLVAVDVDNDSHVDLLGASHTGDAYAFWQNNGDGTFSQSIFAYPMNGPTNPYPVDMDGDNDMDLVIASAYNPQELVWIENEDSEFGVSTVHTVMTPGSFNNIWSVCALDGEGDGDIDIFAAGANGIRWYEQQGGDTWVSHTLTNDSDIYRIVSGDLTSSNLEDFAILRSTGSTFVKWYNNGGGWYQPRPNLGDLPSQAGGWVPAQLIMRDLDSDGDLDVLGAGYNGSSGGVVKWWANLGHPPGAFSPVSPAGGERVADTTPTIVWEESVDPDGNDLVTYELRWDTELPYNNPAIVPDLTETTYTFPGPFVEGTDVYWQIAAIDHDGHETIMTGSHSWFTVHFPTPPGPFSLLTPGNGATVDGNNVPITWEPSVDPNGDEVSYTVYLSTQPIDENDPPAYYLSGWTQTNITLFNLEFGTTYTWHILAVNLDGLDVWANESFSFTTGEGSPPAPFSLREPADGATFEPGGIGMMWWPTEDPDGGTVEYDVFISSEPIDTDDPPDPIAHVDWTPADYLYQAVEGTYYWAVRAIDDEGATTWSTEVNRRFHVSVGGGDEPPSDFSLLSPEDGVSITLPDSAGYSILFAWEESVDPDGDTVTYHAVWTFSLPGDSTFTPVIVSLQGLPSTSLTLGEIDTLGLPADRMRQVDWEVWAHSGNDSTRCEEPWRLYLTPTTAAGETEAGDIPRGFAISEVFPNPFNSTVKVTIALQQSAAVRAVVYDMLGRETAVLTNESMHSGLHTLSWSATDRPAGLYFLQVTTSQGDRAVRKLLLVK
ncbi:MAG TPA: T9SS type A sorting domain-containing protein [Bacteroidetes bacterium]|nr:T9SS type A sorting domain-containing protein [Bacteroidota bacterium]